MTLFSFAHPLFSFSEDHNKNIGCYINYNYRRLHGEYNVQLKKTKKNNMATSKHWVMRSSI